MATKPLEITNWAESTSALKTVTDSQRWGYGWTTRDRLTTGVGEPPNLNHHNYWQNAVHDWLQYEEGEVESQITEIGVLNSDILELVALF